MLWVHHPLDPSAPRTGIDHVLPSFDIREHHAIAVPATPGDVDAALRRVDLFQSRLIRFLFTVRGIPSAARGRMTLEDLRRLLGFAVHVDEPGRELVYGSQRNGDRGLAVVERVDIAFGFRIASAPGGGSTLSTETRVSAADDTARRAFLLYWSLVGPFSALIRRRMLQLVRSAASRPISTP